MSTSDEPAETPEEWAARQIAEHGPPPKALEDLVRSIARRVLSQPPRG